MRFFFGMLLVLLCLPSGGATDRTAYLAAVAGVPIHVFDLQAADISQRFRAFLSEVPMTNDRPLPAALVDDTVASLSFVKAITPVDTPSYFVASYIQKTPLVALGQMDRDRYLQRYGEEVYPQQVCPVFLNRANADAARLLSTAVNLPDIYFEQVRGEPENFDRLFALTEASHCGFIARELANPTVFPRGLSQNQVRTILEALGDFEATAVFRHGLDAGAFQADGDGMDEADVLHAARLLAMFLLDRENPYTPLPGLLREYERVGIDAAHQRLPEIMTSVLVARNTVRSALGIDVGIDAGIRGRFGGAMSLEAVAGLLEKARDGGELDVVDPLAAELIAGLPPAIRLIQGKEHAVAPRRTASAENSVSAPLVTLTGVRLLN